MCARRIAALAYVAAAIACTDIAGPSDLTFAGAGAATGQGAGGSSGVAGAGGSAGAPGTGGAAGGAPVSCVDPPNFCDDFDSGPLGATWTGVSVLDGTIAHDTALFVFAPNAFGSTLTATGATTQRAAQLIMTLPPIQALHCSFDLYVVQPNPGERTRVLMLFVENPDFDAYELNLFITEDGKGLLEEWAIVPNDPGFLTGAPFDGFPVGTWLHVVFHADYGDSARLWIDDNPVATIAMAAQAPLSHTFFLGSHSLGVGPAELVYDNLICSAE